MSYRYAVIVACDGTAHEGERTLNLFQPPEVSAEEAERAFKENLDEFYWTEDGRRHYCPKCTREREEKERVDASQ